MALAPALASADRGELELGVAAVGELPAAGGLDALAQLGLGEVLSLRAGLGGRWSSSGPAADALVGLVGAWDVLAWVPEVAVSAGARVGYDPDVELQVTAGLRRWIGLDRSLTISIGGGYRPRLGQGYGCLSFGFWWRNRA